MLLRFPATRIALPFPRRRGRPSVTRAAAGGGAPCCGRAWRGLPGGAAAELPGGDRGELRGREPSLGASPALTAPRVPALPHTAHVQRGFSRALPHFQERLRDREEKWLGLAAVGIDWLEGDGFNPCKVPLARAAQTGRSCLWHFHCL